MAALSGFGWRGFAGGSSRGPKALGQGLLSVVVLLALGATAPASAQFRVLVTNDDGVGAPGIDAVVEALRASSAVEVTVIAPATNQSGTGDNTTPGSSTFDVTATTTASGYPALAVTGFPADTVLFAVRQVLPAPPDLVVSGINSGQNISREIAEISGTVGAALTAARLGIPAVAVSQGLAAGIDFQQAATYVANLVDRLRRSRGLLRVFRDRDVPGRAVALSLNFPTCTTGTVRGVRVVPLGPLGTVTGYTQLSGTGNTGTFQPAVSSTSPFAPVDCNSTLTDPATDLEAFANGFASATPLGADLTASGVRLRRFRFAERIGF